MLMLPDAGRPAQAVSPVRHSSHPLINCCLYRTSAREELRLQVGTLRFDLNTLSSKLDKSKRKQVNDQKKVFLKEVGPPPPQATPICKLDLHAMCGCLCCPSAI